MIDLRILGETEIIIAIIYLFSVSARLSKRFSFVISSISASVACFSASVGSAVDKGGVMPSCLGAAVAILMKIPRPKALSWLSRLSR